MALTATVNTKVVDDTIEILKMKDVFQYQLSFNRLHIDIGNAVTTNKDEDTLWEKIYVDYLKYHDKFFNHGHRAPNVNNQLGRFFWKCQRKKCKDAGLDVVTIRRRITNRINRNNMQRNTNNDYSIGDSMNYDNNDIIIDSINDNNDSIIDGFNNDGIIDGLNDSYQQP